MAVRRGFWRGKKVFLTGHTGFKGGWLALWLHSLGAEVTGYALSPETQPNLFSAAGVEGATRHIIGDVRDLRAVRAAMSETRPDVVFHLAAQSLVRRSYADPVETYATNVIGTAHVLEAVRLERGARAVVIVTSDKCYENRERAEGYREGEPMGGRDPYASSKGAAELVTAAYRASFFDPARYKDHGVAVASARAGNVIGGGDWSDDRLIPDIYKAAVGSKVVHIRNPKAVRPWQHVLEPVAAYVLLAERLLMDGAQFAEGWNFGPRDSDAIAVADVMNQVLGLWGEGLRWELDKNAHPHEAVLLRLDSSKARDSLGWQPRLRLSEALEWTVEWYKAHLQGQDMQRMTLEQISSYAKQGDA